MITLGLRTSRVLAVSLDVVLKLPPRGGDVLATSGKRWILLSG